MLILGVGLRVVLRLVVLGAIVLGVIVLSAIVLDAAVLAMAVNEIIDDITDTNREYKGEI